MPKVIAAPIHRCRPSEDTLLDQIELSRDIDISRREFAEGKGIPHEQVVRETRAMLDCWIADDRKRTTAP